MYLTSCYRTVDGALFEDEDRARAHEDDLVGEALDALLRVEHSMCREQEKRLLELWLQDSQITAKVAEIHRLLSTIAAHRDEDFGDA